MSLEHEPHPEPTPISRETFMLLAERLTSFNPEVVPVIEVLLARAEFGELNNLHVEYLFDGGALNVMLSLKPPMGFRKR
jgi:hypothetical protein